MKSQNERGKEPPFVIRQMEIDDVSPVYHLGEKLFTSDEFPILYRTWDAFEVTDSFSSDPDYCLVAEADGEIAGFILAYTIEKEGTAWKKYGYVAWIGVDAPFQRSDVGHRLYRKLEEKLIGEGVRMIIADTDAGNRKAIKFFEMLGFTKRAKHVWLAKTIRRSNKSAKRQKAKKNRET